MADLSITAANVRLTDGVAESGKAGATITAGQAIYAVNGDLNNMQLADASSASTSACRGIASNGAASGQPIDWIRSGTMNPGATVAPGTVYVVSATAGGIAPVADLLSSEYTCVIGVGTATNAIKMSIIDSQAAIP